MPAKKTDDAPLILAIDIGTSSVRAAVTDLEASRLPGTMTQLPHTVTTSEEGAAEFDAALLERGVRTCVEGTLKRLRGRRIAAVGVSSFWHSLVGTDRQGKVITPVYTWADSRCREDARGLREEMSEKDYHATTGCMLRASFWPAKLRWLKRTQPRLYERVARWQSPADWLRGRWCEGGEGVTALGMATGTGLFDPGKLDWDDGLLERWGVHRGQLAEIGDQAGRVTGKLTREFPQLAQADWWPAVGDGAASNLGSGATQRGRAAINVGTSAAFRVMMSGAKAEAPFGLFCYRVDRERFVVGGAVSNAGNLRAWCKRELRLPRGDAAIDRALAARPGPLRGLVTLPFWSAERAPTWCEDLGGVLQGMSQSTTALDLLQATTEAVYHRIALIADRSVGNAETEIIVSGGVLHSASLLQRLADVMGRTLRPCREPEASLRGAAVFALEKSGFLSSSLADIRKLAGAAVRPRAKYAALYAKERERQQALEAKLSRNV